MPLTRVEIEQTAPDRWVAEVEQGGITAHRTHVREETPGALLARVAETMGVGREVIQHLGGEQAQGDLMEVRKMASAGTPLVPRSDNERGPQAGKPVQAVQSAVTSATPPAVA